MNFDHVSFSNRSHLGIVYINISFESDDRNIENCCFEKYWFYEPKIYLLLALHVHWISCYYYYYEWHWKCLCLNVSISNFRFQCAVLGFDSYYVRVITEITNLYCCKSSKFVQIERTDYNAKCAIFSLCSQNPAIAVIALFNVYIK